MLMQVNIPLVITIENIKRFSDITVAIASSVVEELQYNLLEKLTSSEIEFEAIKKAFNYQKIFNKVYTTYGLPKLSDTDKELWDHFIEAKKYRNRYIHGTHSQPYDNKQKKDVLKHLNTFNSIASWLSKHIGTTWDIDFNTEDELINAF